MPCRRPEIEKEEPSPFAFIKPKKVGTTENASESDAVIWNRMLDMYYEMGNWKRWLPFYGPVSVEEVEVRIWHYHPRGSIIDVCYIAV